MTTGIAPPSGIDGMAERLRAMAKGREAVDVAQFQFISLTDIEQAYGERWPENKTRILDTAEAFLRRRAHPSDLLVRADAGFLVVFGSSNGPESEAAGHQMSHALNDFFLGALREAAPQFKVVNSSVPVKDLTAQLDDVAIVEPEPAPAPLAGLRGVDWRFQPVWDTRRETLTNWYVTPYLKSLGIRLPGYMFEPASAHPSQFAAIDDTSLVIADQALQRMMDQGKQALVGVSLHITSLTNLSQRSKLLAAIERWSQATMRYRVIKIAAIPPGFPRIYINEIVTLLRARVPNIVLGAAFNEPDLAGLAASGPVALGLALPAWAVGAAATITPDQLRRRISEAVGVAHGARMRFFVEGPIDAPLAGRLKALGVDNISSPRVWPSHSEPDTMLKWPADRLTAA